MPAAHQPDPDSPELTGFLRGAELRRLQGLERRAMLRELFKQGEQPRADPFDPETKPARIMVMWRLCRTSAIVRGLCSEDETLDQATEISPDPWTNHFRPLAVAAAGNSPLRRAQQSRVLKLLGEVLGVPLLPPRSDRAELERWCAAHSRIAADLGVERSREGLLGLQGLLDPDQCVRCDVSSSEVLAFEEMILVLSLDMLLDVGERATIKYFKGEYGFSHKEANGLMHVVKTQAIERSSASVEEKRALMEMRYENMLGRYKESMDMDGELKANKELAKIQGLTRTEPENQAAEFFKVVQDVAARQDKERLDPQTLKLLDGQRAEEVEATIIETKAVPIEPEDPDDAEAIAEYDKENQHR